MMSKTRDPLNNDNVWPILMYYMRYTTLIISPPGAFISPNGYTLTGVMSGNGSDPYGGCPTGCVEVVRGIERCDCPNTRDVRETGFLVDAL